MWLSGLKQPKGDCNCLKALSGSFVPARFDVHGVEIGYFPHQQWD